MKINSFITRFQRKFNDADLQLSTVSIKDDHYKYKIYYKGKLVVSEFKVSHGQKGGNEIHGLKPMARQLGINIEKLKQIESCPFDGKRFILESRKMQSS